MDSSIIVGLFIGAIVLLGLVALKYKPPVCEGEIKRVTIHTPYASAPGAFCEKEKKLND